ncbi:hypothetical protein THAOC_33282 [Thalassiosira oceanica]|uniref:Uncharacterized protein n=1 Tax=Thalassiosira oceanica TaxID=159749 RepID=K0RG45_THAOC|nr:hypothetical protein THAOC_33282 [Thalassiosira oceanica]|eukprot:EJK47961.1 hypothetical protein THAOC_33282 [Thalassiosira oceanica]
MPRPTDRCVFSSRISLDDLQKRDAADVNGYGMGIIADGWDLGIDGPLWEGLPLEKNGGSYKIERSRDQNKTTMTDREDSTLDISIPLGQTQSRLLISQRDVNVCGGADRRDQSSQNQIP